MYDRILVPVDGSDFSEEVIAYARTVSQATGANLALLRVTESDSQEDDAAAYVDALASELQAEALTMGTRGDLAGDILAEARRVPKTLIAITTHGRGGLLTALLGSVARGIVLASETPVLVYRPEGTSGSHEPAAISTVLLPLDGSALSESMGAEAASWARSLGASLTVVQVHPKTRITDSMTPAGDVLESSYVSVYARRIGREYGIPVEWEVLHGDPVSSIAGFVGDRGDVLAVMATRGHTALRTAVLGSVTSGLVHKSRIPVLLHAPRAARSDTAA